MAANIVRVPLHPVDQFEAFTALSEKFTTAEIAARFGISERLVRQRIALGALHPEIREAWRAGRIKEDVARAFTLATDEKRQLQLFKKLEKEQRLYQHIVRSELGVAHDVSTALKIVGADAYRAAGGSIIDDLFGDEHVVSDPELAKAMLADRLKQECDRLVADGWSFAVLVESVQNRWNWHRIKPSGKATPTEEEKSRLATLETEIEEVTAKGDEQDGLSPEDEALVGRLETERDKIQSAIELRKWGPRQKKTAGCFVGISHRGEIEVSYGVQNPKDVAKREKEKAAAGGSDSGAVEEDKPAISDKLALALSEQMTIAAAKTLQNEPGLALCALIAALEARFDIGPVKLRSSGYEAIPDGERADGDADGDRLFDFHAVFAELQAQSQEAVLARLAIAVSKTLDLRRQSAKQSLGVGTAALLNALPADAFEISAREVFDPETYFKGVNANLCNAALDEMGWAMAGGRSKKKGELAAMCVGAARAQGWLPKELRRPEQNGRAAQ